MEKKKLLLVCTLAMALIAGVAEAQDGLVAHWKLDEPSGTTAYDSVGSHNGTLIGSPTWTAGAPEGLNPTGAIDFDCTSSTDARYVDCGDSAALDITGDRSVAAWFRIDDWNVEWAGLVTKGANDGSYNLIRSKYDAVYGGSNDGIAFQVKGMDGSPSSQQVVRGEINVTDGQWHHAVGTYIYDYDDGSGLDVGLLSIYVDGVLDREYVVSGGETVTNNDPVWINGQYGRTLFPNSSVDDVRIYNRALSQGEIEAIMGEFAATDPDPQDGALYVDNNADLSWTGSEAAVSYDVYFGTSESAVASASRLSGDINGDGPVSNPDFSIFSEQWQSSPGNPSADLDGDGNVNLVDSVILAGNWLQIPDPAFKGTQSSTTFDPGTMDVDTTYYWRVDSVDDSEPESPWKGEVWSFTTDAGSVMWEYKEWTVDNPSWSGNEYDVVATATFTHTSSGSTHITEMFYDGSNTWKFRFTGTKTGEWTYATTSSDPELNDLTGDVTVVPNPDPNARGFLTNYGNKFALQVGNNGELEAFRFNVYMNGEDFPEFIHYFTSNATINAYIADATQYGFDTIFIHVCNNWFDFGSLGWDEHSSENPDPQTFAVLENLITIARSQGVHVQIWAWGDDASYRKWTPTGAGGINGIPDRRIQRYIAARLGPVPGWTMSYGFDLHEWTTEEQLGSWALYLHQHFGWQHMLWARDRYHSELDAKSYPGIANANDEPFSYDDAVSRLDGDTTRPHLFEERFWLDRSQNDGEPDLIWTANATRRALWHYTMAGGMGSWWGFYFDNGRWWYNDPPYPNPEQLVTVNTFWEDRFLLDMERANSLTDGYCLKTTANDNYVFYKENTSSVQMDLSGMATALPAIAVDTINDYAEIDIGTLSPSSQTWNAPYASDWAVAVGDFD